MEPSAAISESGILYSSPPEWLDIHPIDALKRSLTRAGGALAVPDVAPLDPHGINTLWEHWNLALSSARILMSEAKIPVATVDEDLEAANSAFESLWAAHTDLTKCWGSGLEDDKKQLEIANIRREYQDLLVSGQYRVMDRLHELQLSTAVTWRAMTSNRSAEVDAPHWDETIKTLTYKGEVQREYPLKPANIPFTIMNQFNVEGWLDQSGRPNRIKPDLDIVNMARLTHTVRNMNTGLRQTGRMRFHLRCGFITWSSTARDAAK